MDYSGNRGFNALCAEKNLDTEVDWDNHGISDFGSDISRNFVIVIM